MYCDTGPPVLRHRSTGHLQNAVLGKALSATNEAMLIGGYVWYI